MRSTPLRREERDCVSHGKTEHTLAVVGDGHSLTWQCLRCKCDASKDLRERKAAGDPVRSWKRKPKEREVKFCNFHFLALNALGECDDCNDNLLRGN